MNDEEKLKEVFDFNSSKTKKILQRARSLTLIRTITTSLLVFILLSIITVVANAMMLNRIGNNELCNENIFNSIAGPNIHIDYCQLNDGFLAGEAEYNTYRIVGNRPIYNGTYKITYNIIPVAQGLYGTSKNQLIQIENEAAANGMGFNFYNQVGHREMTFYHPRIEYENYPTDLDLLDDIGENKYLEFALSFDRGYSIEEVQQMLPGQVKKQLGIG